MGKVVGERKIFFELVKKKIYGGQGGADFLLLAGGNTNWRDGNVF